MSDEYIIDQAEYVPAELPANPLFDDTAELSRLLDLTRRSIEVGPRCSGGAS